MELLRQIGSLLSDIGWNGVGDIALVTLVIYTFLVAVKRTRRSGLIFAGIVVVGLIYVAALKFNLPLTVALLQGFFAVILVAMVVIFQEDLRYFFERVGLWWVERRLPTYKRTAARLARRETEVLARTLGDLARAKIGALIVIRGKDSIAGHLDGGDEVKGLISEPLLKSIFDPHSIGHDGAVVIDGHIIERLGCHLPLSKNFEKLPRSGTRHAAALGLSERSDALCVVVSEERGTISVARRGDIWSIATPADLVDILEAFYDEFSPRVERRFWPELLQRNYREKAIAFGLAVALWVLVVHRSQVVQRTFGVPVNYSLLPADLTIVRMDPPIVQATFTGQRRDFAFMKTNDVKLTLELWDAREGQRHISITRNDLRFPGDLVLDDIEPRRVFLNVKRKAPNPPNSR